VSELETLGPLDRTTTSGQVTQALREMIVAGRLAPGTPLREAQLSSSLGVSRNTLREALRGLVAQGLVTHLPHRGAVVTDVTEADVADLFHVRWVIESAALPSAAADVARLETLGELVASFETALRADDHVAALEQDLAFHRSVVAALGSPRIDDIYARTQDELRPALLQLDAMYRDLSQAAEHRRLLDALRSGNLERAGKLLDRHLRSADSHVQALIRGRSEPETTNPTTKAASDIHERST
jgi:DNA-binding GntR family transcriptional regulator